MNKRGGEEQTLYMASSRSNYESSTEAVQREKTHYESLIRILNSLQSSVMVIQISTREYKIDCGLSFYYQLTICQLDSSSILQDYHTLVCSK